MASPRPAVIPAARTPTPTTRLVGDGELSGPLGAAAGGPPLVGDGKLIGPLGAATGGPPRVGDVEVAATPGAPPRPGSPPSASARDPKHSRVKPERYWPGSSCNVVSPEDGDANRSHGPGVAGT